MSTQILMSVSSNQGYAPDQVTDSMTLGDLLKAVEEAIADFGPDMMIVTNNGDRYGASYGGIDPWRDLFTEIEGDDEDEDDENECQGHESTRGDSMGASVFCDGTCVS